MGEGWCSVYPVKPQCERNEVLTNIKIIELVKRGSSDAVVIEKIQCATPYFDVTPKGLKQLKEAGVSEPVIQQMANAQKKVSSGTATAESSTTATQAATGNANSTTPQLTPTQRRTAEEATRRANRSVPVPEGGNQNTTTPPSNPPTEAITATPATANKTQTRSKKKRRQRRRSQP